MVIKIYRKGSFFNSRSVPENQVNDKNINKELADKLFQRFKFLPEDKIEQYSFKNEKNQVLEIGGEFPKLKTRIEKKYYVSDQYGNQISGIFDDLYSAEKWSANAEYMEHKDGDPDFETHIETFYEEVMLP